MSPAKVIRTRDVALVFSEWSLDGTDQSGNPFRLAGCTSDVVRRQADGRWLLVIDSPFGSSGILGEP